jgi:hypothetical protein
LQPHDHPANSSTTLTLTCRVTREQHQAVVAWARESGQTLSDYLRDAVFAATEATADALETAREDGVQAERVSARAELQALQAQLDQACHAAAQWQRHAAKLQSDVRITSQRLVVGVVRVLGSTPGARTELGRLWGCLSPTEQARMLPAIAAAITERVDNACQANRPRTSDVANALRIYANARWISEVVTPGSGAGETSDAAGEEGTVTVLRALTQALTTIAQCFQRAGGSLQDQPDPPEVGARSPTDPARGGGDEPGSPPVALAVTEAVYAAGIPHAVGSLEPGGPWESDALHSLGGFGANRASNARTMPLWSGVNVDASSSPIRSEDVDRRLSGTHVLGGERPIGATPIIPADTADLDIPNSAVPSSASTLRWGVVSGPIKTVDPTATPPDQ